VRFSSDPAASFGNTSGQSVPGTTYDGSVEIQGGTPGDCNADQRVDAGDISALVLEIFDGDGSAPANTPGGTFPGDPVGCNANQDAVVDAGDISCTVLIIFNGPNACAAQTSRTPIEEPAAPPGPAQPAANPGLTVPDRAPAAPNSTVTLPITFAAGDHQISSLIFSLDYDQAWLSFDPTDGDEDGIPDAVTLNLPAGFNGSVMFNAGDADGELDFFVADTFPPLAWLPDGTLASVTLHTGVPPTSTEAAVNFSADPAASFGNTAGQSVPGITDNGSVWIELPLAAPVVSATRDSDSIELRWTQTQSGIVRYEVWRSTDPYFMPGEAGSQKFIPNPPTPGLGKEAIFMDAFGEPLPTNYYYVVVAVGAGEATSPPSNRVAAFHFTLTPGAP
jgi:hypothetical protein